MDGDGDMDVLSASFWDDRIAWYQNNGSQNFTPHTITSLAFGASSVFAADVDGDGDLDVLSASVLGNTVAWYDNLQSADLGDAPEPSYPTLLASNGAAHGATGPTLGTNRDSETDGTGAVRSAQVSATSGSWSDAWSANSALTWTGSISCSRSATDGDATM